MLAWLFVTSLFAVDSWSTFWHNNQAARSLGKDDTLSAMGELQKGLSTSDGGMEASLHYNLGLTFEKQKDYENAAKEYSMASRFARSEELKFQSEFNAAHALGEHKKIPEALEHYQKALQIRPDSQEVKTNIELLLSKGGGGGEGDKESEPNDEDKDKKGGGGGDQDKKQQQKKQQPRQFRSKEMSEQDVKRILDELKQQEEKVRGKELNKKPKESPNGKDW